MRTNLPLKKVLCFLCVCVGVEIYIEEGKVSRGAFLTFLKVAGFVVKVVEA